MIFNHTYDVKLPLKDPLLSIFPQLPEINLWRTKIIKNGVSLIPSRTVEQKRKATHTLFIAYGIEEYLLSESL